MKALVLTLSMTTLALASMLAILVAHPYYAHRLAAVVGSDHLGYRSIVAAETMALVNAERMSQGQTNLAFFGASTIQRLDTRRFGKDTLNLGYGGWTSRNLRDYWRANPDLAKIQRVVILVGYNDLASGRTIAEVSDDFEALLSMRPLGQYMLIIGVLPINPGNTGGGVTNARISELNSRIEEVCIQASNCHFADPVRDQSGFAAPLEHRFDSGDGIHLTPEGNNRLADFIEAQLDG